MWIHVLILKKWKLSRWFIKRFSNIFKRYFICRTVWKSCFQWRLSSVLLKLLWLKLCLITFPKNKWLWHRDVVASSITVITLATVNRGGVFMGRLLWGLSLLSSASQWLLSSYKYVDRTLQLEGLWGLVKYNCFTRNRRPHSNTQALWLNLPARCSATNRSMTA